MWLTDSFGHFYWKVEGSSVHARESRTAHMWKGHSSVEGALTCGHVQLTCGRGTHVWELLTCGSCSRVEGGTHVWSHTAHVWLRTDHVWKGTHV